MKTIGVWLMLPVIEPSLNYLLFWGKCTGICSIPETARAEEK